MVKAVLVTGGKQYLVTPGDQIAIERPRNIDLAAESTMTFDDLRLIVDGEQITVGTPSVSGAVLTAKVLKEQKSKKVTGVKFKRRRRYHKRIGHRQTQLLIEIMAIDTPSATAGRKSKIKL